MQSFQEVQDPDIVHPHHPETFSEFLCFQEAFHSQGTAPQFPIPPMARRRFLLGMMVDEQGIVVGKMVTDLQDVECSPSLLIQ